MLVISNEGELQHTDTCMDIIEHSGVKGMKWGQRRAKQIGSLARKGGRAIGTVAKLQGNSLIHPALTVRARAKHIADRGIVKSAYDAYVHPVKTADKYNKFIKKNNKSTNLKYGLGQGALLNSKAPKGFKSGVKIAAKGIKNEVVHPFLYNRAVHKQASKGLVSHVFANTVHPIKSTHEHNTFVEKQLAAKKAKKAAKKAKRA